MPLSPPSIVSPLSACSDKVRLQGQFTNATVTIYASPNNIWEEVFSGQAPGPDEIFKLNRRLRAGENVHATQSVPGNSAGSSILEETVEPQPVPSELRVISPASHLHVCARGAAFGNGLPGAEVVVVSQSRGELGRADTDPMTGAARIAFSAALKAGEQLTAQQSICGLSGPVGSLPIPDFPANSERVLPAPNLRGPLHACERAVLVEDVEVGAIVRLFRDGVEYSATCFDYSGLWLRVADPLKKNELIKVDQRFPDCELNSPFSVELRVGPPDAVRAPEMVGPFCKGTRRIGVSGLRFGARVRIVQTSGSFAMGLDVADAEAWDEFCDIPLTEPLDPVRGKYLIAIQSLCGRDSPESARCEAHALHGDLPAPWIVAPLAECGQMVRVAGIEPGARIEIFMSCANAPGIRKIAARQVHAKIADILVVPALQGGKAVFARQIACDQTIDSAKVDVGRFADLHAPVIEDCEDHLHVTGVVPGARVEVYRNGSFFKDGRSGSSDVRIPLAAPLPAGDVVKARQCLCAAVSQFGLALTIRDNVEKRHLAVMPVEVAGSPKFPMFKEFSTERVCQLTGNNDPEGIPILNNWPTGLAGTDLGIVVDHETGDGRLYFFFGDTTVRDLPFPDDTDCMARTGAAAAGQFGPKLDFLHDGPFPRPCNIPGMTQGAFEVPTGGFSHAGKLYLFATTDHYHDTPITIGLFKDNNYMGSSVLAAASDWRDDFIIVPGHEEISSRRQEISSRTRETSGGFKFINIAPWKIKNDDWHGLPDNAVQGGEGLFLIGSGRYRESRPCLAYVPLPAGHDPVFSQWRYLSGYTARSSQSGPCGTPRWSAMQQDAIFLWDDMQFFRPITLTEPPVLEPPVPQNKGVVGELSIAFLPQLRLWIALYAGGKARTASHPWGPWSNPIDLFFWPRDHADPARPGDPRPRYINSDGSTYGPYIVPRFTEYEPVTGDTTIYYAMSTWRPYQAVLLRTTVRLECEYREIQCGTLS